MSFYKNKRVLVTGGTGLIGIVVVRKLLEQGAKVSVAALKHHGPVYPDVEFYQGNLTHWDFCKRIVKNVDFVFHLACTKGNVTNGQSMAASFFVPHLIFNTFMMEAARQGNIDRYLYASTIGVYPDLPSFFKEENAWQGAPHATNLYSGWAKRMGELQAEAYKSQFGWDKIAIVRPAHVYGPFDDFNASSSLVIPSLIRRALNRENPFVVWGDGKAVRDFVYVDDVAEGILLALEKAADCTPINLGSGEPTTINNLVQVICSFVPGLRVEWDTSKPNGQSMRVLDISLARSRLGYQPTASLKEGIGKTIEWYEGCQGNLPQFHHPLQEENLI